MSQGILIWNIKAPTLTDQRLFARFKLQTEWITELQNDRQYKNNMPSDLRSRGGIKQNNIRHTAKTTALAKKRNEEKRTAKTTTFSEEKNWNQIRRTPKRLQRLLKKMKQNKMCYKDYNACWKKWSKIRCATKTTTLAEKKNPERNKTYNKTIALVEKRIKIPVRRAAETTALAEKTVWNTGKTYFKDNSLCWKKE